MGLGALAGYQTTDAQGGSGRGTEHPEHWLPHMGVARLKRASQKDLPDSNVVLGARRWGRGVRGKERGICSPGPAELGHGGQWVFQLLLATSTLPSAVANLSPPSASV